MKKAAVFAILLILITMFVACGGQSNQVSVRDENLAKLGRVWGFVKYTHHSFISGQLDWDNELLNLIPVIYYADAADVNGILYDWFVGLGDDGFDLAPFHDFDLASYLTELVVMLDSVSTAFLDEHNLWDMYVANRQLHAHFSAMLADGHDLDWLSFVTLAHEKFPELSATLPPESDDNWRPMADLSWINYDYLGPLAAHLLRFDGIRTTDRTVAPVSFGPSSVPSFSNKSLHIGIDLSDTANRLLGLFRLWNAMNYYFPHLDVLDVVWDDLLIEFIPKMLEGTDKLSYELTIAAMAHHLHDAHVRFVRSFYSTHFFTDAFGRYVAPVHLVAAQGRLVVSEHGQHSPFARGDVIIGLDGRGIEDIIAERRKYISYPNDEKLLPLLALGWRGPALSSHTRNMEITVLRDGVEMSFDVTGAARSNPLPIATQPHELLDNNIGLINPGIYGDVRSIMKSFAQTDGLIIDLRQRPTTDRLHREMRQYLMAEPLPFVYVSRPSHAQPGARVDQLVNQYLPRSPYAFVYDRPVVLLMDERTFSHPEWVIMSFRVAPNVTVLGPFSMGSNGNIAGLPLPGGITMWFTSLGVYTPEGGQTHRIGLAPDIHVDRTIEGITEGRDELMEAAVRYIMGN